MKWSISKDAVPDYCTQVTVYDESSKRVATVFQKEAIPLIAAAPELLEACKEALQDYVGCDVSRFTKFETGKMNKLIAAITKAEGNV